jgi:nucleoside 2-deoxyribosyltransferase
MFEVGYARAKGIPVFAYAETLSPEALKMVVGSDCIVISDFVSCVYRTIWKR